MKKPSGAAIFSAAVFLLVALPMLGWLGLPGFVGAHGFDTPDVKPRLSRAALLSGRWQKQVGDHFAHVFFGRTELLFLKNGLHDTATLGADRAGFAGSIVQGRRGFLFERPYVETALRASLPIERRFISVSSASALRRFAEALDSFCAREKPGGRPPAVAFVLAPSKAETLRQLLPSRVLSFSARPAESDPQPYRQWREILGQCGVPFAATEDAAPPEGSPEIAAFAYTGTHWTVYSAALAASAVLRRAVPDARRPVPSGFSLVRGQPDDPRDRDLANLLNLPVRYRRAPDTYAHAEFAAPAGGPRRTRVLLIGDSFTEQFREALVRGGASRPEDVELFFNELPPVPHLRDAILKTDVIVFVHSAPSLAGTRVRDTLSVLANDLAPNVRTDIRYALARSPFALEGDWRETDDARALWLPPGASGTIELPSERPLPEGCTLRLHRQGRGDAPIDMPLSPPTDGSALRVGVKNPASATGPLVLSAFEVLPPSN